ncbi:GNAT family N-acetyltransferase [Pseudomonas matsuisoli]|uniref:N-acetyltransferase n=1 Tax=Pseudomonas matsuisoli TaxID=1515666 RepID=A0A917UW57_9PSED|nr:GNAT family N-acetyltransferase [Pseudomonas matsuisoli]GGJ89091.1 N-acetyltransferase [Pseudomonas matsuisoli]
MTIEIRPITPDDYEHWLPLWLGYQAFYQTVIPEDATGTTWQRFLDEREPMNAAIAWDGDRAVGMVHWIYHRSCWTVSDYCYLQDLFVDSTQRGSGIGRALIEFVYARAEQDGAGRVHWLTQEGNLQARQLYDRIADRPGFIQYRHLFKKG